MANATNALLWSDEEIQEHALGVQRFALDRLRENGQVLPMFFLFVTRDLATGLPRKGLIPVAFEHSEHTSQDADDAFKDKVANYVRSAARELYAQAVLYVAEAWYVQLPPGEDVAKVRASTHRERKEAIFLTLETRKAASIRSWKCPIERAPGTDAPLASVWEELPPAPMEGRFANFLEHGS